MVRTYRTTAAAVALVVLLVVAGCGLPTAGSSSNAEYRSDAGDYLLTSAEFGDGWTENVTRQPKIDSARIESGRVVELENKSSRLQISVLVFQSSTDAARFLSEQRAAYTSSGLNATNQSLGDDAIAATVPSGTFFDIREANVYVQVVGRVRPETARRYSRAQLRKIRDD